MKRKMEKETETALYRGLWTLNPKPQTLGIRGPQGLGRVQGLGPRLQDSGPIGFKVCGC